MNYHINGLHRLDNDNVLYKHVALSFIKLANLNTIKYNLVTNTEHLVCIDLITK